MIPIEKVQSIIDTYEALEKDLASGNIDKKDFHEPSELITWPIGGFSNLPQNNSSINVQ